MEEDLEGKLKRAKQISLAYNIIGFLGNCLFLFYASLRAEILMGLIYPLLSIPLMKFSGGLIKFSSDSKQNPTPNICIGFMISVFFLFIISVNAYQIFRYENLWLIIIIAVFSKTILIYLTGLNRLEGNIRNQILAIFFISLVYGFSSVVIANCAFDNTSPTIYKAIVINRNVENGKHTC